MTISPNGCSHCGIPERGHARQWTEAASWHQWVPPTSEQIKVRMTARRAARTDPTDPEARHDAR